MAGGMKTVYTPSISISRNSNKSEKKPKSSKHATMLRLTEFANIPWTYDKNKEMQSPFALPFHFGVKQRMVAQSLMPNGKWKRFVVRHQRQNNGLKGDRV